MKITTLEFVQETHICIGFEIEKSSRLEIVNSDRISLALDIPLKLVVNPECFVVEVLLKMSPFV